MLELTRRMNISRNCFDRIAGCYFDRDGEIDDTFNTWFISLSGADKTKNLELAKTIPFSRTNEQLREYRFSAEAMRPGGIWQLLSGIHACGLKNDLILEVLYEQIGHLSQQTSLAGKDTGVYILHGTYDVPVKAQDKERLDESEEVYDFIICAVSEVGDDYEMGKPRYGFLFPAFSDRSSWQEGIDIYEAEPGEFPAELLQLITGQK